MSRARNTGAQATSASVTSSRATIEQKQEGHEVFDKLLSGIFGTSLQDDRKVRSIL